MGKDAASLEIQILGLNVKVQWTNSLPVFLFNPDHMLEVKVRSQFQFWATSHLVLFSTWEPLSQNLYVIPEDNQLEASDFLIFESPWNRKGESATFKRMI